MLLHTEEILLKKIIKLYSLNVNPNTVYYIPDNIEEYQICHQLKLHDCLSGGAPGATYKLTEFGRNYFN